MNKSTESAKKYGEILSFPLLSDPSHEMLHFLMRHPMIPDYHRVTPELAERLMVMVEDAKLAFPQKILWPSALKLEATYQNEMRLLRVRSRVSKDSFFFPRTLEIEEGAAKVSEEIRQMLQSTDFFLERILRLEVDGVGWRQSLNASVSVEVTVCQTLWREHFLSFPELGAFLLQQAGLAEAKKIGDIRVFTMGTCDDPKTKSPAGWWYTLLQE